MSNNYARTTITNEDGTISTARINLTTGEIKPYTYNKASTPEYVRAKPKFAPIHKEPKDYAQQSDLLGYTPIWITVPPPDTNKRLATPTQTRRTKENINNIYLKEYITFEDAVEDIPELDNLITGVSHLDYGSNKPINKKLIFSMLRDLDCINTETVQTYTGYSSTYCSRLAQYARVASNAFDMLVEK